jgi:hypothetical protein
LQELIEHRAGNSAPLKQYLTDHVLEPWLNAAWVQSDLRASHADEYLSQLHAGLGNVLGRLKDRETMPDDATAKDVERYCRYELRHARDQMYKFRRKGDKGRARAYAVVRRRRSDKPIQGRDDEEIRYPSILDDGTVTDRHPESIVSRYGESPMSDVEDGLERLDTELIELRPFVEDDREFQLWMKLFFRVGFSHDRDVIHRGLQPKYARDFMDDLRGRKKGAA